MQRKYVREASDRLRASERRERVMDYAERFKLTMDHAASSYGQPVLVDRETSEAYGPADLLEIDGEIIAAEGGARLGR